MLNRVRGLIGGVVKGLLPSLLPIVLIGSSFFASYVMFKQVQSLKTTVQEQRQVIGDLREVNKEVRGLYISIQERTDLIGKQSLQDILRLESTYFKLDATHKLIMDTPLPTEVIKALEGSNE